MTGAKMGMMIDRLINYLPSYFDKASDPIPIFTVLQSPRKLLFFDYKGIMYKISLIDDELIFYLADGTQENIEIVDGELIFYDADGVQTNIQILWSDIASIDLNLEKRIMQVVDTNGSYATFSIYNLKVGALASGLADLGYKVEKTTSAYDNLLWFTLVEYQGNDNTVYFENSLLRRFVGSIAQFLIDTDKDYDKGLQEIMFSESHTVWLDLWGQYFGHGRKTGETDALYFKRIIQEILALKTNNISLSKIIQKVTGYYAEIVDLGRYVQNVFYSNHPTIFGSLTNIDNGRVLFNTDTMTYNMRRNAFGVYLYVGNINNLDAYTESIIRLLVDRYRASGNFPYYYAPTTLLHTNTASEVLNNKGYCDGPKTSGWTQVN